MTLAAATPPCPNPLIIIPRYGPALFFLLSTVFPVVPLSSPPASVSRTYKSNAKRLLARGPGSGLFFDVLLVSTVPASPRGVNEPASRSDINHSAGRSESWRTNENYKLSPAVFFGFFVFYIFNGTDNAPQTGPKSKVVGNHKFTISSFGARWESHELAAVRVLTSRRTARPLPP